MYCPSPVCSGHQFTDEQLRDERRALRPYSLTPSTERRRYSDPDKCFRVHDAERAARAQAGEGEVRTLPDGLPIRAHVIGCPNTLRVPVDLCPCGGRDFLPDVWPVARQEF